MPCETKPERIDATGRARAGSQRQLQTYVNCRRDEFSQKVLASLDPSPGLDARLCWRSPLADDKFKEYRDAEFLERLRLTCSTELKEFWPGRGPCWDALAQVTPLHPGRRDTGRSKESHHRDRKQVRSEIFTLA